MTAALPALVALAALSTPAAHASGTERSMYAATLGGVDVLNGDAAALGELRLRGGLGRSSDAASWSAWYLGDLLGWFPDAASDSHLLEIQAHTHAAMAPGATISARGSASSGWLELLPAASLQLSPAPGDLLLLRAGPALRSADDVAGVGLGTTALFSAATSPRLRFDLRADARAWPEDDAPLPRALLELDGGARWSPAPALALLASVGLSRSGGEASETGLYVAGLRPAGSRTLRGWTAAELELGRGAALRLELIGERTTGSLEISRLKLAAGLSMRANHLSPPDTPAWSGETLFTLSAADADEVMITGSFNDWAPLPMTRGEDGEWQLAMALPPGTYEYCYLVDGRPVPPPEALVRRSDGFGGENGVLLIPNA